MMDITPQDKQLRKRGKFFRVTGARNPAVYELGTLIAARQKVPVLRI
jgi:hypothetical protein